MEVNELPKNILWSNPGGQRGRGQPKSRGIDGVEEDARKLGCRKWRADVQDRGHWRHLLEKAKAPTQGSRADDDDDDDDETILNEVSKFLLISMHREGMLFYLLTYSMEQSPS